MSDPRFEAHVFVCTNRKEGKPCCANEGGEAFQSALKKLAMDPARGWYGRVRINKSGCLDQCQNGVACVIYPQGRWFLNLHPGDELRVLRAVEEILKDPKPQS